MKIILPTDFSENAQNAVRYAIALFGLEGVEYSLLNCYTMPHTGAELLISLNDILRLESQEALEKEYNSLLSEMPELEGIISTRAEEGMLENVLSRLQQNEHPDLVVMGTSGSAGKLHALFGSTTTSTLRRVALPLLLVPGGMSYEPIRKVALALPSQKVHRFVSPPFFHKILKNTNPDLSIISVESKPREEQQQVVTMSDGSNALAARHYFLYESDPVDGILDFIKRNPVDLLVMVTREYSLLQYLFHNSTTREIALISKVPLLVLREN